MFIAMDPVLNGFDNNAAGSNPAPTPLAMTQLWQQLVRLTLGRGKARFTAPVGAQ